MRAAIRKPVSAREVGAASAIEEYLAQVRATLAALPTADLERIIGVLDEARMAGKQVFILGNGGSAATASHFASDLAKGAITPGKPRFKAFALTDNMPLFSAWANDAAYEDVFAQQLSNFIQPGDVVIAISGSGKSPNVLKAVHLARSVGATTIGLTGDMGGELQRTTDVCLVVPNRCMEQIEDVHLVIEHVITTCLRGGGR